MYLMVDNYDSFVHNLAVYMQELGREVILIRNDKINIEDIRNLYNGKRLEGIIISPGPKSPSDCGNSAQIVKEMGEQVPILGVCLGHQIIGHTFGALVKKGVRPMHGKISKIEHDGTGVFKNLPQNFSATRYHSLVVSEENLPSCLRVTARAEDGSIQGLCHTTLPIYGVQFHPEAVLTEFGHSLLKNFIDICEEWWKNYEYDSEEA